MQLHPATRVEEYRSTGAWRNQSWNQFLQSHATLRPDQTALVDPPNRADFTDGEPGRWTWSDLEAAVEDLACVFDASGIGADDVVGVQMPNVKELIQTYLALSRVGAIVSPFPVQFRRHELVELGNVVGMRACVTSAQIGDRANAEVMQQLQREVSSLELVFAFGRNVPAHVIGIGERLSTLGRPPCLPSHRIDGNDCVTVCWTSGTEATPKGIPRSHDDWIALTLNQIEAARMTERDVILGLFPLVNMAGIGGTMLPWLITGGRLVLHHPFDLDIFLRQLEDENVTFTVAGPALLTRLLQERESLSRTRLASLRAIGSGSAPLPPETIRGWEVDRGVEIHNLYGSNEGVSLINGAKTVPAAEDRSTVFPRWGRPDVEWSGIRPNQWMATKLVDLDTGSEVTKPGVAGELRAKGPGIFSGYLEEQSMPSPFDDEGYCRSGDLFEIAGDDERYYRYVDRAKDIIIRGGFNISAAEIEHLVLSHPAVLEVAAVGYADPVLGERTCVFVVLQPGASLGLEELCRYLTTLEIASYKLPERMEIAESLPRNPLGKVVKSQLRSALTEADQVAPQR